jgi:hypothetical protein
MQLPTLGQPVTYENAAGEDRPGKVVALRHLPHYAYAVATVQAEGGWNMDIPVHALKWDAPPVLDRAELAILLDLAETTETDMRDGALVGTSWDLDEVTALVAKLRTLSK